MPRRDAAIANANSANTLAALAAIIVAAGGGGDAALGVLLGGNDQATRKLFQNIRYDEAVADELGLSLLDKTNISAEGLRNMMQRLAAQRALPDNRQSRYYTTHPGASKRLSVYQDYINARAGQTFQLPAGFANLSNRLVIKLRAYVESPTLVLERYKVSNSADHQYATAIAHYRRGDLALALIIIDRLVKAEPKDPFFYEFRGDVLMSLAKPQAAATAYEKALSHRNNSPQILLNLGRALIASGQSSNLKQAIDALKKASQGEPKWAFAHRQLAIAYGRAGQLSDANITLAEEALLLGDTQQAIRMARRVLAEANIRDELRNRANDILFRYEATSN